jgi:hypothetical protein
MPLIFTSAGVSAGRNGPTAKPAATHEAMASVTSRGWASALAALVLREARRKLPLQPMSAPPVKSRHTISNLARSEVPTAMAMLFSCVANIRDFPFPKFFGNLDQNSAPKLMSF